MWEAEDKLEVFDSGWTFDHFQPILSDPTGPCLEGWLALTALGQMTRRLRIGVLVTGVVYRHPAVLANMAATLDHISGGRLELGLGAAWYDVECAAYGIELGTLRERFDRFDEACEVIFSLLTREVTDFAGMHYRPTAARCAPKPLQQPHPPICIGGRGERRTLRAVARWAQHWNLPSGDVWEFRHERSVLESHCDARGRNAAEIITSTHLRLAADGDVGPLLEQALAFDEAGLDLGIVRLEPPYSPVVLERIANALVVNGLA